MPVLEVFTGRGCNILKGDGRTVHEFEDIPMDQDHCRGRVEFWVPGRIEPGVVAAWDALSSNEIGC